MDLSHSSTARHVQAWHAGVSGGNLNTTWDQGVFNDLVKANITLLPEADRRVFLWVNNTRSLKPPAPTDALLLPKLIAVASAYVACVEANCRHLLIPHMLPTLHAPLTPFSAHPCRAWDGRLRFGVLPTSQFCNGFVYFHRVRAPLPLTQHCVLQNKKLECRAACGGATCCNLRSCRNSSLHKGSTVLT